MTKMTKSNDVEKASKSGLQDSIKAHADLLRRSLEKKAFWHRQNVNDPHGIGTCVSTCLLEVSDAVGKCIFGDQETATEREGIPAPGKYWVRSKDVLGHTQWRIVWVRRGVASDKIECVELGRSEPWSDGFINNIIKPEEWIPITPPNGKDQA